ncbi:MAG: FAD-binding oxidoreductase [Phycisphaerales bacterium]
MPRYRDETLACWGNHPRQRCASARPETWRALDDVLRDHTHPSRIARGLGRSYGDAALNEDGAVVRTRRLDRAIAFDPRTGTLHAEAGLSLKDVNTHFLPRGWFPGVTPGSAYVTLGGAIAADVHGKNHHTEGAFARWTEAIELLLPGDDDGGSWHARWVSRDDDPELFHATLGGMGLTGVIRRAKVRLKRVPSAHIEAHYKRAANLDEALEGFAGDFGRFPYSVAWIDCLATGRDAGRSVLIGGDHAPAEALPEALRDQPHRVAPPARRRVPFDFPSFALNPLTVRAFNAVYYHARRPDRRIEPAHEFFYPLDAILEWNRIYGKPGFQQYQVVLPFDRGAQGVRTLLDRIARARAASFLAVLKAMGDASEGPLSFPMPGWTLALDLKQTPRLDALLADLDAITVEFGGRRYLAKDASLSRDHFEAMYPHLNAFMSVRARVDPHARLSSSLSRRLGLDP